MSLEDLGKATTPSADVEVAESRKFAEEGKVREGLSEALRVRHPCVDKQAAAGTAIEERSNRGTEIEERSNRGTEIEERQAGLRREACYSTDRRGVGLLLPQPLQEMPAPAPCRDALPLPLQERPLPLPQPLEERPLSAAARATESMTCDGMQSPPEHSEGGRARGGVMLWGDPEHSEDSLEVSEVRSPQRPLHFTLLGGGGMPQLAAADALRKEDESPLSHVPPKSVTTPPSLATHTLPPPRALPRPLPEARRGGRRGGGGSRSSASACTPSGSVRGSQLQ
jgi:hypothetical protein